MERPLGMLQLGIPGGRLPYSVPITSMRSIAVNSVLGLCS
jgi:hypothetical protein